MTGKKFEIISQIVLWYENSFRIDCKCSAICTASTQFLLVIPYGSVSFT